VPRALFVLFGHAARSQDRMALNVEGEDFSRNGIAQCVPRARCWSGRIFTSTTLLPLRQDVTAGDDPRGRQAVQTRFAP